MSVPNWVDLLQQSVALHQAGRQQEAEAGYRTVVGERPECAAAWHLLGVIEYQRGNDAEAENLIRKALVLHEPAASFHSNLCEVLRRQRRFSEAIASGRRAIELEPNFADAHNNLGYALQLDGQLDAAAIEFDATLQIQATHAGALNNRGLLRYRRGDPRAIQDFLAAVAASPTFAEGHNNLGMVLFQLGQFSAAEESFTRALELNPDYPEAINNLGMLHLAIGDTERAINKLERSLELRCQYVEAWSNRLLAEQYRDDVTLAANRALIARWQGEIVTHWRQAATHHPNEPDPGRRLRLGFVSADLCAHPLARWFESVVRGLDRSSFEITCFSNRISGDEVTQRLQDAADFWIEIATSDDRTVSDLICRERIDILFDLSGHTAGHRLAVFAGKPAPVQVSWLGFLSSTGLPAIDVLLADDALVPQELEHFYVEQIERLPNGYACFQPPHDAPDVSACPSMKSGQITFGSINNPTKLTAGVLAAWGTILRSVPESRLILQYRGCDDRLVSNRIMSAMTASGVERGRITLRGYAPRHVSLATYGEIDVALDPFPFNGFTTTIETLYMGVPVVTLPGETMASRQSLSILRGIGWMEGVARNVEDYVARAIRLAHDLPQRQHLRETLRERVKQAPYCNAEKFLPAFAASLRGLWQRWCAKHRQPD